MVDGELSAMLQSGGDLLKQTNKNKKTAEQTIEAGNVLIM